MRVLHVGSGFRPFRRGGLVAYAEDLMAEQVGRGHDVTYFFSGRHYPVARGPRLRRWARGGVAMLEVVDSPLYDHGRQPGLELDEPEVERMFAAVLDEVRPDVVHVQELAGLPSSVLGIARDADAPVVVTLQDYFALCPAFKLLDAEGRVCLRRDVGADCVATTAADPRPPGILIDGTVQLHLKRLPVLRSATGPRPRHYIRRAAQRISAVEAERRRRRAPRVPADGAAAAFQRRRDVNVARLNGADRVVAMSHRVAEIHRQLGVDERRLTTIHLTLAHIERLTPRRIVPSAPLTFGTLAGFESEAKGGLLLLDAMRALEAHARAGRLRLLVLGDIDPRLRAMADGVAGIEIRGRYPTGGQDRALDEIDVGLVPSVWEEAYGFAGMEFLAKGIPVIANAIGGMPDYVRDGETGWLNHSCSATELARLMDGLVARPEAVRERNAALIAGRDAIVTPLARHADEIDALYAEVAGAPA